MVSIFTPNLQLEEPATGDYANTWALPVNSNWSTLDTAIGAIATIALTTGSVILTQAQANSAGLIFTGSLSGNVTITYPTTCGGRKFFFNNCTMNAHTIQIRGGGGTDTKGILFSTAQAWPTDFIVTGFRVYWDYGSISPGALAGFPVNFVPPGWLVCDGSLYSTTQYDFLFALLQYGYGGSGVNFAVPDYRGYADVGSDNMLGPAGNAGRFFNLGAGGVTGAIAVALGVPDLAPHSHTVIDPTHAHGASQPPHSHGGVVTGFGGGANFAAGAGWSLTVGSTGPAQPAITVSPAATGISLQATGNGTAHSNVQPSRTRNIYIKW